MVGGWDQHHRLYAVAALITFAPDPWYPVYAESARAWGLEPLTDQQLAGVLMWIPSGLIYTGVGIGLVVSWVADGSVSTDPQTAMTVPLDQKDDRLRRSKH